ncbi:MAG: metalloregulator ArsR/SmtB family transcription factor [Myxococcales bacterium]|nr:metalloregulator ArsR/SmtB family transcription factor [Myxococcales bacterium]
MTTPVFDRLAALAEPIRVRLLRVLQHEELAVGEIARVLQTSQPTVSRHLKQLDAGEWVLRRRVGTATYYRLALAELPPDARALWELVLADVEAGANDPASQYAEDLRRLSGVVAARSADSEELFRRLGGRWDCVRTELFGDDFVLATLMALLPEGLRIADLGCGTGALLPVLAQGSATVVGVDREATMLEVAASRTAGLANVTLSAGNLDELPLADASVDLALCQLVLHHVLELGPVFAEVARVLSPGGRLVIVDMVEHDRDEYRHTMGHQHLGFTPETVRALANASGLALRSWRPLPADPKAQGPGLFVAVARR